jgi:MATE family multidrug resistance protein
MNFTDTVFVGRLGTSELAAIGLAANQVFLANATFIGLLEGLRVRVAHAAGGGRTGEARHLAWSGLAIALVAGVAVATWAPFGRQIFAFLGADRAVAADAGWSFAWRITGAPLIFVNVALAAWFQGRGDTRTPMIAAVTANAMNMLLDPLLIFGFGPISAHGIEGAGIASACAQIAGTSVTLVAARPLWREGRLAPRWQDVRAIAKVGGPIALNAVLDVGSFTIFAAFLANSGQAQLAAHVVAVRLLSVSFLPGNAIGEAAGVLVGQSIGAGRPERAREVWRSALGLAVVVMALLGAVITMFPSFFLSPFALQPDVELVATHVMWIAAALQIFDAIATSSLYTLNGAGDTRFTLGFTLTAAWLIRMPLAGFLAVGLGFGAVGAWSALALEFVFAAAVLSTRVRGDRWLPRS